MHSFNASGLGTSRLKIAGMLALLLMLSTTHAATVYGVVRKLSDSTSIEGVKVYRLNAGVRVDSATTDSWGTFWLFDVPAGATLIAAELAGYATSYLPSSSFFYMGAPGSISGVVRRASDSVSMAGRVVYLRRSSATSVILDSTMTDAQGAYTFSNVAPGAPNYWVSSIAEGFAETANTNVALADGGATGSDIFVLHLGKIIANVRKASDSTAIANAFVLLRQGQTDSSPVIDSGRTDALGNHTFSNLSATTGGGGGPTLYRVYASAPGFRETKKTGLYVRNGSVLLTDLTFTTTVSISQGPGLSSQKRFTATPAGNGWLIRLPAAATNRAFTVHDARGVVIHRTIVPAGAAELVIPGMATQADVMMRLD
jgi:hypothetical protein